ncbi:MAG: Wadjet anti-phage system protein JetD domain-containing protein [Acidimicrobiales bacterium]
MTLWTNVDDLVTTLRKRWKTGRYIRDYAEGVPFTPIELPVKAPSANELLDRFDEAVRWVERFERDGRTTGGVARFSVAYRTVRGRNFGTNSVPARIRIESFEQLCTLLGTTRAVRDLDLVLEQTGRTVPDLVPWVVSHPLEAIGHRDVWSDLLAVVVWIAAVPVEHLYLRQIDVEGIDTKFVDRHRKLLDGLLTAVLPEERIDNRYTAGDFARRFRFQPKPNYTRFRLLGPEPALPGGVTELTLRTEELASLELASHTVFIVENEITYLAFPGVPGAIVVFGSGFGLGSLRPLPWLERKEIVYWGDIDTHGFDILNRLRARFDNVRSILMDQPTLLAHPRQWVTEPSPTNRPLPNLTGPERALYGDLVEDRFGPSVRLEQERVRFSLLQHALAPWMP